jgi:hypothetical protein
MTNVLRFPDRPINVKIGLPNIMGIQTHNIVSWGQFNHIQTEMFMGIINEYMPDVVAVVEQNNIKYRLVSVEEQDSVTSIVILQDDRISYLTNSGVCRVSRNPVNAQEFLRDLRKAL